MNIVPYIFSCISTDKTYCWYGFQSSVLKKINLISWQYLMNLILKKCNAKVQIIFSKMFVWNCGIDEALAFPVST